MKVIINTAYQCEVCNSYHINAESALKCEESHEFMKTCTHDYRYSTDITEETLEITPVCHKCRYQSEAVYLWEADVTKELSEKLYNLIKENV